MEISQPGMVDRFGARLKLPGMIRIFLAAVFLDLYSLPCRSGCANGLNRTLVSQYAEPKMGCR